MNIALRILSNANLQTNIEKSRYFECERVIFCVQCLYVVRYQLQLGKLIKEKSDREKCEKEEKKKRSINRDKENFEECVIWTAWQLGPEHRSYRATTSHTIHLQVKCNLMERNSLNRRHFEWETFRFHLAMQYGRNRTMN